MPSVRPPLVLLAALLGATALVACTPPGDPKVDPQGGRVVAIENLSTFFSIVSAGGVENCLARADHEPEPDDFETFVVAADIACSKVVDGVGHGAEIVANASLSFEHDGPGDTLSAIRFSSRVVSNRSATGLASSATLHRVLLRFDVEDEPVAFTATGAVDCADGSASFLRLRDVDVPGFGFEVGAVFVEYCQTFDDPMRTYLSETGTLPTGRYEVRVELATVDWFTEVLEFVLRFGD